MLTVYRASAGSGKTFTLAVEYIKLLVQNPMAYRQTLAVTFTNKATEEMKMRILSQLFGIWRGLPKSDDYAEKVCSELGVSRGYAAEQAGKALTLLLHNYSYFHVETIDSFFQSVLRNLARELELTANLRVGLNDAQVEEQAVDQMIDSLQPKDKMLAWVMGYIMDSISEDRSWNVIGQIKKFGKTIFRDYYKQESRELNRVVAQEGFIDDYAAMLQAIRAKAKREMTAIADSFFEAIADEGLTVDDFSGKSRGLCSIFIKLRRGEMDEGIITKTVADAVGDPSKWYAKSSPRAQLIHALAEGRLGSLLRQAVGEQPRQWRLYKSADLTLRHLSQLRLLNSIETRVRLLNEESNRFLLSDTQQLLHDLIEGSDSPFIYERIGTQIEHIMIDEFQDTSTVQWKNFKVLLREALSHRDGSGLVVGDVKQSIYRWRSGDWRLLAAIREEFAPTGEQVEIHQLDTNYRSEPRVISFNNAFFTEAARQEEVTAYDDVKQKWPDGKETKGFVEVTLLPQDDYVDTTLNAVTERVQRLMADGAQAGQIAVLVRNNAYIPILANHLLQALPGVDIVSDEAFRLDASPAVQLIIHALRYIAHRDDAITRAFLAKRARTARRPAARSLRRPPRRAVTAAALRADGADICHLQPFVGRSLSMCLLRQGGRICRGKQREHRRLPAPMGRDALQHHHTKPGNKRPAHHLHPQVERAGVPSCHHTLLRLAPGAQRHTVVPSEGNTVQPSAISTHRLQCEGYEGHHLRGLLRRGA